MITKGYPSIEPVCRCPIVHTIRHIWKEVVATGLGYMPAVRVCTTKMGRIDSRPVQERDLQLLGEPNRDPYLLTRVVCQVWLDPSVPITGSGYRVILLLVALRYPNVNHTRLTLVCHCLFSMLWPPFDSRKRDTHSLPNPENQSQQSVNDCSSCTVRILSGDWSQTFPSKL